MSVQLPAHPLLEGGQVRSLPARRVFEPGRELRERNQPQRVGVEETAQIEPDRLSEYEQLLVGEGIHDLFIEVLEVPVCLERNAEGGGQFGNLAAARLARGG